MKKLTVKDTEINMQTVKGEDYLCLTDMLRAKDGEFFITDWLRNRNTLEFIGIWEQINNPDFNYGEFAIIRNKSGLNNFKISVKEFAERTNAISIQAKAGRYGGTYAHKDIAFEFGMWISPEFKIYLIKEFQRLKTEEQKHLGWEAKRELARINYKIHTDAIKQNLIPLQLTCVECAIVYASEADVLNKALFHMTAKEWRDANPDSKGNIRDYASIEQLLILANLESLNAEFVKMGLTQPHRLMKLNASAISQMTSLLETHGIVARGTRIADNLLLASDKKKEKKD